MCFTDVPYKHGNTSNLQSHLQRKHRVQQHPPAPPENTQQPKLQSLFEKKLAQSNPKSKNITRAIAAFIAFDMRPFSVVDNEGFRHLISTLEPRYDIPSRTHFAESVIPGLYMKVKERVKNEVNNAQTLALTSDSWTSRATENFLAVTVHFIEDWSIKAYTLETKKFCDQHTAENLADALKCVVTVWNLERNGKMPAISTDNASNIVKAVHLAGFNPHLPCFAHTLNVATSKGLAVREVEKLLVRVRRVVTFFHRSTTAASLLKQKQSLLGLKENKLIMDVPTRWNSSYDMVVRYLEQQAAIFAALLSKNLKKGTDIVTLSEADYANLEDVVKVLGPLKTATTSLCSTNYPTVSLIHPMKERLLQEVRVNPDDNTLIKSMKTSIMNDLLPRYTDPDLVMFLHLSSAMDPRFKSLPYVSDEERESIFTEVLNETLKIEVDHPHLIQPKVENEMPETGEPSLPSLKAIKQEQSAVAALGLQTGADSGEDTDEPPTKVPKVEEPSRDDLDNLFGDVFITGVQAPHSKQDRIRHELQGYRSEPSPMVRSNPLEWWKERQMAYPLLSRLAKNVLTVPATSVESERVFSTAGDIVCHQRASLSSENVNRLVFLKKNIDMKSDIL